MKALVLGGYGAVGARIVSTLRFAGDGAVAADRDPARADRVVDLDDPESLRAATADIDVVVNASGIEDPGAVGLLTELGLAVVDVTATAGYIAALEHLDLGPGGARERRALTRAHEPAGGRGARGVAVRSD